MRKILHPTFGRLFNKNWVLAATLICGTSVFTSCSSDNYDNPVPESGASASTNAPLRTTATYF